MTAKNNRPAAGRTVEISWGDCSQSTARRRPLHGGGHITTTIWIHWELERYRLQTETPGRFGYFTTEDAK